MAKTSSIQRNLKRIKLVKKFSKKRKDLKKIIINHDVVTKKVPPILVFASNSSDQKIAINKS